MDGVFVGSEYSSRTIQTMADAIVLATAHYDDGAKVAEAGYDHGRSNAWR